MGGATERALAPCIDNHLPLILIGAMSSSPAARPAPPAAYRRARCRRHVILGGMTLAVPGSTGFVALAQRAVIKHVRAWPRPISPERGYADVRAFHRAPTGPEFAEGGPEYAAGGRSLSASQTSTSGRRSGRYQPRGEST